MVLRFLLFLKRHFPSVWGIAEWGNGLLFRFTSGRRLEASALRICKRHSDGAWSFRPLESADIPRLAAFFAEQPEESYRYFRPHGFDAKSLKRLWRNPAFLPMLAICPTGEIAGYFMIRFFCNREAFVGFLVGTSFQGRGLAGRMCRITFNICRANHFRAFATVSAKNERALAAYRRVCGIRVVKQLPDDYLCIEYVQNKPEYKESACILS